MAITAPMTWRSTRRCSRARSGRPVKVQWMRDDEFQWEPYGSAMISNARQGLAADGTIVDWQYELWSGTHNGGLARRMA